MINVCKFKNGDRCSVLKEMRCEKCSFFKTENQFRKGRLEARERIESLPPKQNAHILEKYYDRGFQYNKQRGIV